MLREGGGLEVVILGEKKSKEKARVEGEIRLEWDEGYLEKEGVVKSVWRGWVWKVLVRIIRYVCLRGCFNLEFYILDGRLS